MLPWQVDDNWAACDKCGKWRRLPETFLVTEDAEFVCAMTVRAHASLSLSISLFFLFVSLLALSVPGGVGPMTPPPPSMKVRASAHTVNAVREVTINQTADYAVREVTVK